MANSNLMIAALILIVAVLILSGCASLKKTIGDISNDPATFIEESQKLAGETEANFPGLPAWSYLAIGYAGRFLQKWNENRNIKKAQTYAKVTMQAIFLCIGLDLLFRMLLGVALVGGAIALTL
jgi:hypothetical protein